MPESKSIRALFISMPLGVSITFHLVVFGTIAVIPWAVQRQSTSKTLIIASTSLDQGSQGIRFEDSHEIDQPRQQGELPAVDQEWIRKPAENFLRDLASPQADSDSIITLGAGGSSASVRDAVGDKIRMRAGSEGPRFFGQGGDESQATRIVYVVDRSGSMINTFDALRSELERSIEGLNLRQSFHIIFFSEKTPIENPPGKLVRAIKTNKAQAFSFLKNIVPEGRTDPTDAMQRAFDVKPEIIFFLTDGEFSADLLAKLDKWNRNRKVKIYTYAYVYQPGKTLLERIAREHGGKYKFISEDEIFK